MFLSGFQHSIMTRIFAFFATILTAVAALALVALPASAKDSSAPAASANAASTASASSGAKARPANASAKKSPMQIDYNPKDDPDNILYLDLSNGKRVTIRLMPAWAPKTVKRIKTLTREGFYNGLIFHRVINGFMAQTGDPTGTGRGGSSLPDIPEEFNGMPHVRGTVSMARGANPNSGNSQFFIMFYPRLSLDRHYTNFGRVIAGMDGVDEIHRGDPPKDPTRILQASLGSQHLPQKMPQSVSSDAGQAKAPKTKTTITAAQLNNSKSD